MTLGDCGHTKVSEFHIYNSEKHWSVIYELHLNRHITSK